MSNGGSEQNEAFREGAPPPSLEMPPASQLSDAIRQGAPPPSPTGIPTPGAGGVAIRKGAPPGGLTELPESAQVRNSLVFFINTSISYLVAPVFYVGVLHAAIIHSYGLSDKIANLPESVYFWVIPLPVILAWILPSTRFVRPLLVWTYVLKGAGGFAAAALFFWAPTSWLVAGIVVHAAIIGATNGVTNMCLWDLIGRGMTEKRRGWTLGLTYGIGPIFAVVGSCLSQLVLHGNFLDLSILRVEPIPKPWSYVVLFGFTGPAMLVSAACVYLAHVPPAGAEEPKPSLARILEGLHAYFMHPLILLALCGFLMTFAGGNALLPSLTLFVRDQIPGAMPEAYAGDMLALRFGFKSIFGFALGWMLAKSFPKLPALATTLISLAGVVWALAVPGKLYLFSFCLLGAGELFYVYYLNYIVGCSAPERIRENTAYTNLISGNIGFMPLIYGTISDGYGLKASLTVGLTILSIATLIITAYLPRRPSAKVGRL